MNFQRTIVTTLALPRGCKSISWSSSVCKRCYSSNNVGEVCKLGEECLQWRDFLPVVTEMMTLRAQGSNYIDYAIIAEGITTLVKFPEITPELLEVAGNA